jgi:hypothetical protein
MGEAQKRSHMLGTGKFGVHSCPLASTVFRQPNLAQWGVILRFPVSSTGIRYILLEFVGITVIVTLVSSGFQWISVDFRCLLAELNGI